MAFDLGLHCLLTFHKKDARLKRVNKDADLTVCVETMISVHLFLIRSNVYLKAAYSVTMNIFRKTFFSF